MIKVVIVDDEKMIRDGLVYTMPWDELQIEVVGSAGNGRAALDIIREKKPNLVFTDIRMSEMDGIELLQVLKQEMPNVKVVILSGYDDFQYAQKALKLGALDYLVKPVNADELIKLLEDFKKSVKSDIDADIIKLNLQTLIDNELEQYITAVRSGNREKAFAVADKIYEKSINIELPLEQYNKICIEILNLICSKIRKYDLEDAISNSFTELYLEIYKIFKKEEFKEWIYDFTKRLFFIIADKNSDNYRLVIRKAIEYIDAHYSEDISAQKIAQVVFLNPNYFSHLFKKIKKESFTDYLNKVRIEQAKQLLRDNLYKVYEVSDMVGYSDYKYFSSIFKKLVGVTPTEYNKLPK